MILIGGTSYRVEDLPMHDVMEYQIEAGQPLAIKLKTVAKSPTCFNIYLHEKLKSEVTITEDISSKITFFKDDDELINLLENGKTEEEDIFEEETVEVPVFEQPEIKEQEVSDFTESTEDEDDEESNVDKENDEVREERNLFELPELEEVNTDLPDFFLQIPNISDDTDSLKVQLENKDKLIKQKEGMIKDLELQIADAYKLQEIHMLEIKDLYEKKIEEANAAIAELKEKVTDVQIDPESMKFLKFASYSKNHKASLKEGFTETEKKALGRLNSQYSIFACSSGDSLYSMMKQIKKLIDKNPNLIIVDFSNDHYLTTSTNLKSQYNSMDITKIAENNNLDILSMFKTIGGNTKLSPTTLYNDISLLSVDWVDILRRIDDYAGGVPVLLIFNNINSFSVRYTVSKLATIGKLFVFAKCTPLVLSAVFGDIKFIPEGRVTLVALEYIAVVKSILDVISKTYPTIAFSSDVEWHKLGIK